MALALQLAEKGLYTTAPNPCVGCVIVKQGEIVGTGYHRQAGQAHAEVYALREAGEKAKGACAYVTLEPCSHVGRTPPCCEALIEAGISRVVIAMQDPNPCVAGKGVEKLKQAGLIVSVGLLGAQAQALNKGFLSRMTKAIPFVRLKSALSIDGRTAMASGESQWITGPAARLDVQRLRARSSAIVSGLRSVQRDNAALTVRPETWRTEAADVYPDVPTDFPDGMGRIRQPLRVIIDTRLETSLSLRVFSEPGKTVLAVSEQSLESKISRIKQGKLAAMGVAIWPIPTLLDAQGKPRVDLSALLAQLAQRECNDVLVETGASLAGGFMQQNLVDELWLYVAPKILGSDAMALFDWPLSKLSDSRQLVINHVRQIGSDLRIVLMPEKTLS